MGFTLLLAVSIFFLLALFSVVFYYSRKLTSLREEMQRQAQEEAKALFSQWTQQYSNSLKGELEQSIRKDYEVELEKWRQKSEKEIRKDAITRSMNTLLGRIGEEFAPFLVAEKLGVNPKDFRHLGTPVDFVAFKGLSDNSTPEETEIIFIEVKSGRSSSLTERERKVRDAILSKRVRYEVINLSQEVEEVRSKMEGELSKLTEGKEGRDTTPRPPP